MKRDLEFAVGRKPLSDWWRAAPVDAVALTVACIVVGFLPTVQSIVAIWIRSETFAHGFFVVPICLWLAWRQRKTLAATPARVWWWGLPFVLASGALWLVAQAAGAGVVAQFAVVFMVQAAIVTIVGLRVARVLAFSLAFLLFAVPFGEFLVPTLMDWTADFTVAALRLSGIPVHREGNHFIIPSGAWSVVETCSGIRYIIASLVVGTIYAAIAYRSATRRALFIAASIVVPIVANWLRAYMIVMIGHLSNNKLAVGVDHIIYGWIFFGVVMLLLFWVGSFWQESGTPDDELALAGSASPRIATTPARAYFLAALAAIAITLIWRPIDARVRDSVATGQPQVLAIDGGSPWTKTTESIAKWKPHYTGYANDLAETYAKGDRRVGLYIAFYRRQEKEHELITSGNVLTTPAEWQWKQVAMGTERIDWSGQSTVVERAELSGAATRLEVMRLFWISGRITWNPYVAKALQAIAKLRGEGDDAALIVMYAPVVGSTEQTQQSLRTFAAEMSPAIERALAAASSSGR